MISAEGPIVDLDHLSEARFSGGPPMKSVLITGCSSGLGFSAYAALFRRFFGWTKVRATLRNS